MEIELVGLDAEDVAGRSGRQHVLRKCLAKSRDVDAQCGGGVLGRVPAPELVDQPVSGNDLVGMQKEPGEERARLAPTEGNLASPVPHLERSQDPELDLTGHPAEDANRCSSAETDLKRTGSIIGFGGEQNGMQKGDARMSQQMSEDMHRTVVEGCVSGGCQRRPMQKGRLLGACVALALLAAIAAPQVTARADAPQVDGRIVFHSNRAGSFDIFAMNADGSEQLRLTRSPADDYWPAWSPDGDTIAFTSTRAGNPEIYVMDGNGGNQRRLTRNGAADAWPAWSPDGHRIAFASRRSGNDEIHVMNADGSGQRRLTEIGASDMPVWSPDGRRIAFTSRRDGNDEIYVIDADGSRERRLTRSKAEDFSPAWSPDGRLIAVTSFREGRFGIDLMNADGTHQRRLLADPMGDTLLPDWSPDGGRIAFQLYTAAGLEIYVVDMNGTGVRRLTHNDWLDAAPDWQPATPVARLKRT